MEIILKSRNKRVKKKVIRDHYWYDPETKKRLHERGGRMIFVYDHISKRSKPKIVDHEEWTTENSYEDLMKWVNKQHLDIAHRAPGLYVTINVEASEWMVLEDILHRNNIPYDYDEREFKSEYKKESKKWQNSQSKSPIRLLH